MSFLIQRNKIESDLSKIKTVKQEKDGSYQLHDQVIHFKGGTKRYIPHVKYIWENEMLHLVTSEGYEFIINKDNVLFVERRLKFENDKL
jgi:hypothetical protein